MDYSKQLIDKFNNKTARVAVLGMGYVGLPFSTVFANAGFNVTGIDPIQSKMEKLNRGESYIIDVAPELVKKLVGEGKLRGTSDYSVLKDIDAVAICVPTPLRNTGDPDLSFIISAAEGIAPYVHPGMVVVLESSTYPGTTRELVLPTLTEKSGLKVGEELFVAFSPERVDPGRKDWTTKNTPKVIGGMTENCTKVSSAWYSQALDTVVPVSSTEVAEMAKLLENTFRMINIGFVNELTLMCDRLGVDVWEVIDAASTKPFGFMRFDPGPGLGGHCIPIDPLYLSWKMRSLNYTAKFIDLASEINTNMPRYVVGKVQDALNDHEKAIKGSKVLVLGTAYKPDIDDLRESPAIDVIRLLEQKGAAISYYDPYIPVIKEDGWEIKSIPDMLTGIREADCVVIVTNHKCFDYDQILKESRLIVDTRNAYGRMGIKNPKVVRL